MIEKLLEIVPHRTRVDVCNPMRALLTDSSTGEPRNSPAGPTSGCPPSFIDAYVLNALGFDMSVRRRDQNKDMYSRPLDRFTDRQNTATCTVSLRISRRRKDHNGAREVTGLS